jgi:peptide/nickel transport system permease protein
MTQFIGRRLLLLLPVLLGILLITFSLARLIPGDPCYIMLGEKATPEKCFAFRERFGLNDSIPVQFVRYAQNLAQGNLGTSIKDSRDISDIVAERLPMTIELTVFATAFSSLLGVTLGVVSAVRHNSAIDVGAMVFANIGVSMPIFWLGLLLAYLFALTLAGTPFQLPPSTRLTSGADLPSLLKVWGLEDATGLQRFLLLMLSNSVILNSIIQGKWDILGDALKHMILPTVTVGTVSLAIIARMTRGAMLDVLTQDFIRVARAKGLREWAVIMKHAFRNASSRSSVCNSAGCFRALC